MGLLPYRLFFFSGLPFALVLLSVEGGVEGVEVFGVQLVCYDAKGFAKALEVDDLPLAEEAYCITDVRVVTQPQDVVVGCAGFLFCCNGKSATFASKINPIGFILYHIPLKTEYITIFARKLYHILPLAKYITKNSNILLSERPFLGEFSCLRKCSQ